MAVLEVINIKGEKVGTVTLHPEIFEGEIHQDAVYQDVRRLLAVRREGTASTKTRKDVRGGGVKPWRQKGTGRARVGSIRVPHWRGGGVVFGPHPRDYSFSVPKKVTRAALKSAFRDKLKTNSIIILDELKLAQSKTKELTSIFQKLKLKEKKVIFLLDSKDEGFSRAVGNMKRIACKEINSANTFDLLYYELIVFTKRAFGSFEKRIAASVRKGSPGKQATIDKSSSVKDRRGQRHLKEEK